jgi:hypothetical protein
VSQALISVNVLQSSQHDTAVGVQALDPRAGLRQMPAKTLAETGAVLLLISMSFCCSLQPPACSEIVLFAEPGRQVPAAVRLTSLQC